MLNRIGWFRHVLVVAGVVITAGLGAFSVVGAGNQGLLRAEHFDAKQVTVRPEGADGVRIREVVDIDFGLSERRGYQRIIRNDFGEPIDVVAASPDANDELRVIDFGNETRIRVGDPLVTFTGQHRYVLEYTLPDAEISTGNLALDIIGTDETFVTDRFEVILSGFDPGGAENLRCDTGRTGDFGGCTFDETGASEYRALIESLQPERGITVSGSIDRVGTPDFGPLPQLPERNPTGFQLIGLVQLIVGLLVAGGIFVWFRRQGSNDVFGAGGAADAAFIPTPGGTGRAGTLQGELPVPAQGDWVSDVPTHRVPDSRLAELATVEFVPPRGVEPWQGNVLLRESVTDETVSAWFSEMIARGAIEIRGEGKQMTLSPGQTDARLSAVDRGQLAELFRSSPVVSLGTYDSGFAGVWSNIRREQVRFIDDSGWWHRHGVTPGLASGAGGAITILFAAIGIGVVLVAFVVLAIAFGFLETPVGAVALSVVVAAVLAAVSYAAMLASRTATGSALTLRTESFRRFLDASEGRHVDWAWEQGLIREYSAWAVALGAADAWSKAIESSSIEDVDRFTTPMLIHTYASTLSSSHTAPSSSGSGGGGGGVGGGGGGGSSGSW